MKIIDYDELERRVTEMWRSQVNADNDVVTAAQIRGAEASGKVAGWIAREHDLAQKLAKETGDPTATLIPMQALAALTSNEAYNMALMANEPRRAAALFLRVLTDYLNDMLTAEENGDDEVGQKTGLTVHGGAMDVPKKDVPN